MHRGSTTLWGYNAATSAAGMHRGCLCTRRDTSRLPPHAHILHYMQSPFLLSNKAGMPHGYLPGWGDASWMPPLSQGPHFLQNLPYWRKRSVRERHRKEPNFATRDRSNEASDCDLRPFPDPSAPLGIERWLRSQRASAPRELMPRLHSPCNKNSKRRGALSWDASRLHSHVDTSAHSCVHVPSDPRSGSQYWSSVTAIAQNRWPGRSKAARALSVITSGWSPCCHISSKSCMACPHALITALQVIILV